MRTARHPAPIRRTRTATAATPLRITLADATLPKLGRVRLATTEAGICALAMPDWNDHQLGLEPWTRAGATCAKGRHPHLDLAFAELRGYVAGRLKVFTVPVDLAQLTPFFLRVLTELQRVPHGAVLTYGQLADLAGSPRAARAVGQAVGRNPVAVIVPCHRVLAGNGIGGFGLGLEAKRMLLGIEGIEA
ncbi:MAG: methylated-DNA--[protein]-cysteine S-methyltransferase [Planctomycetes bacterium]|nr:methylated-DNA--[protein]-cysteine S-methyltransferase [Planctomycetota bacterium]